MRRSNNRMNRRQFLRNAGVGAAGVGAAMMGMSGVASAAAYTKGGTLSNVIKRGYLSVASHPGLYGFWQNAYPSDPNHPINMGGHPLPWGIEADFARAIAAAIFGADLGPSKIQWHPSDTVTRFTYLQDGTADVAIRTCTNTTTRDVSQVFNGKDFGVDFAPTYFYDGANVLLSDGAPSNAGIAVARPSTSYDVLVEAKAKYGLSWVIVDVGPSTTDAKNAWVTGTFNGQPVHGFCTDSSGLIAAALGNPEIDASLYFTSPLSKEPLAGMTREDDPNWTDLVRWVFYVLMEAEEKGITQANVDQFPLFGTFGTTAAKLGLSPEWAKDIIRAVGNYKEIYERNLWEDVWYIEKAMAPPIASSRAQPLWKSIVTRGANDLWTNGGLLYSPAFR